MGSMNLNIDWEDYNLPDVFALSIDRWAKGQIVVTGDGRLTHCPTLNDSSIVALFHDAGKIEVPFEALIIYLDKLNIEFNSRELASAPISSCAVQQAKRQEYLMHCADLGRSITAKILAAVK